MTAGHIAFVSPPFAGHLNPMLKLALAAVRAGYEGTVITGHAKLGAVSGLGLNAVSLPSLAGEDLEQIANTQMRIGSNPLRLLKQLRLSLHVVIAARDDLLSLWRGSPPDLVVADSVAVAGGLAASFLGIPWITTIATPFAIECHKGVPSYIGGWSERDTAFYTLRDKVGRALIRNVKRGLAFVVKQQLAILGTSLYREDGSESCYSPTSILGFGIKELEFERDWPKHFRMIGPVFSNPEDLAIPALPKTSPKILVTLGTHLPWAKATLAQDLTWLASHRPSITFVGSLGSIGRDESKVQKLAANAQLHSFIPYADCISSFDAVIHHGGAGVTYAAICAGKPAVVVPHDYDQFDFAARIVAKGAGLRVKRLRSEATLAAIDQVLESANFRDLPKLTLAANSYRPEEIFLEELTKLIGS